MKKMKYFPCCTLQTEEFVAIQSALRQCTDVARIWEGTVEGESLRIYFGFSIFFLKHLLLTFQKLAKHLHKDKRGWAATKESNSDLHFAEVCTNLRPKWFLLKKGKMSYFFFFPFEVSRYHFANSKDNWTTFFSWRASINCIWICLQCHCQHGTTSHHIRRVFYLVSVQCQSAIFTVQTDFLFCLDHCMHSKDNEDESTQ